MGDATSTSFSSGGRHSKVGCSAPKHMKSLQKFCPAYKRPLPFCYFHFHSPLWLAGNVLDSGLESMNVLYVDLHLRPFLTSSFLFICHHPPGLGFPNNGPLNYVQVMLEPILPCLTASLNLQPGRCIHLTFSKSS